MRYFYAIGRAVDGSASNKFGLAGKGFASKEVAQKKLDEIIVSQKENGEIIMIDPALVEIEVQHRPETATKKTRSITPKVAKAYFANHGIPVDSETEDTEAAE